MQIAHISQVHFAHIDTKPEACMNRFRQLVGATMGRKLIWGAGIIGVLWVIGTLNAPKQPAAITSPTVIPSRISAPMPTPIDNLRLSRTEWRAAAGGSIAEMRFEISNAGTRAVKDPRIECEFSGSSGTTLSTRRITVADNVDQKYTLKTKWLNLGFIDQQSKFSSCKIIDAAWF